MRRAPPRLLPRIAGICALAASAALLMVLARSFVWPTVWADKAFDLAPGGVISQCFSFGSPRQVIVHLDTKGSGPVAAGIVPSDAARTLAADTMARHTVAGGYAAAVVDGRLDARVDAEHDYCVMVFGGPSSAQVSLKIETYLRLW